METQEEDAAGCSGGPSASVQFEATRRIRSGPYQDGGRPISNPFPSFQQPRDGEILQQLEQICLNGDVDEQSSPERTRQPADIFEGVHNNGEKIAVKRIHNMLGFEEEQFLKVFNNLARLDHPNIVRLAGYCYDVQNQYVEYKERLVFAERIIGRSALSICIMEALANIFLDSETIGPCTEASYNYIGVTRQGINTTKVSRLVGNYELGRTIGEGTFTKVKYARNLRTGQSVAIKIIDKEKVLKHKMVEQIKRGIFAMKLIEHPNVVRILEVMGSKTKIYLVLEYVARGDLLDTIVNRGRMREGEARRYFQQLINVVDYCHSRDVYHLNLKPEKLLLDSWGNLKVSEFGLGPLSEQIMTDGVLRTTYGTPNYVAPEVLEDVGYDGGTADVWSCGVILFVLLAGYLPFEDSNLTRLYKKISNADFTFPPWTSSAAKMLLTRILDPNPMTRITIPEILEDEWFKEGYRRQEFDKKYDITTLDDMNAIFQDSEEHFVTERNEEPVSLNAFDLISSSSGLNLQNLLDSEQEFKREIRIEEAAAALGFSVQKKNYVLRLEKLEAGRKGNLNVIAEILQVAPSFHVIEVGIAEGDTLEFHKFCKDLSKTLKDIFWKFDDI